MFLPVHYAIYFSNEVILLLDMYIDIFSVFFFQKNIVVFDMYYGDLVFTESIQVEDTTSWDFVCK